MLILLVLFFFTLDYTYTAQQYDYDGYQVIRVHLGNSREKVVALHKFSEFFDSKSMQFWKRRPDMKGTVDIFVSPEKADKFRNFLKRKGIKFEIIDANFGKLLKQHISYVSYEPEEIKKESDFNLDKFHPFDSIVQYLHILAESHPDFVRVQSLGKTFEGRDHPIITLGYRNGKSKKPALLVDAGIHAREWIAHATALRFINAFINDPSLHLLLHEIDVHIVPVLNPDGYVYSWTKDRLWRKTRSGPRKADAALCSAKVIADYEDGEHHCYGTDGNRNFPYKWGIPGSSNCPCGETYRGESALSEPETQNLARFIRANNATLKAWWILHTFSAWIAYDTRSSKENVKELNRVAHEMTGAIKKAGGGKYAVMDVEYLCPGCSLDFGRSQNIKFVYLMELTNGYYKDKYYGFAFPEESVKEVAISILPALRILAEEVRKDAKI